jgi:hypothetical protein
MIIFKESGLACLGYIKAVTRAIQAHASQAEVNLDLVT